MPEYIDFTYWHRFLNKISESESDLGNPEVVWYRGHSNINYKLVPSLYRYSNKGLITDRCRKAFSQNVALSSNHR